MAQTLLYSPHAPSAEEERPGLIVNELKTHSCESCKGTGKVVSQRTEVFHGVKRTSEFLVDCPGKLTERFLSGPAAPDAGKRSGTR